MTADTVRNYIDLNTKFEVYKEAYNIALGAILESNGRSITYSSRLFEKVELNNSSYELECGAIIFVLKQFRKYLLGKYFNIFCDNEL